MYDIYACDTEDGRKRLTGRVQAARTLERAKDPGGLGFALDTVLAFVDGKEKSTLTGGATGGVNTDPCRLIPAARPLAATTSAIFRLASSIISSPSITAPRAPPAAEVCQA